MDNTVGDLNKCSVDNLFQDMVSRSMAVADHVDAAQSLLTGLMKYNGDFVTPLIVSSIYFNNAEASSFFESNPHDRLQSYIELFQFNLDLLSRYLDGSLKAIDAYNSRELKHCVTALYNTIFSLKGEKLDEFISRQSEMVRNVTKSFPQAISDIEPEYGFHFERGENIKFAETDRFSLYQIMPTDPGVKIRENRKPVIIIPPFVLGSNILAFLPGEKRSYAHSFANQGIPTYIRIMKDINTTPLFQVMTMEDDARDTRMFCEKVKERHGKMVTLNGYCQGGYTAVCNILSGELDGLVDALITCVSPMDGTRSTGLGNFLKTLPPRFNDLIYGTKTLANGNKVADGNLMGWVYKLKSIENEAPLVSFFRDLSMVAAANGNTVKISKTAAALNYWLKYERSDLPLSITKMSFASYNIPVTDDGTLPVKMFGRKLNFKGIAEKKIPWLICYGENDDLVEKETALAPLDYIEAEVTPFPKGHVAIATSWSHPESEYALHKRFGKNNYRGPVRYQLDLDDAMEKTTSSAKTEKRR
ncbi:MAG: metal transporter [Desulfosalsimonadaceae bacterium]